MWRLLALLFGLLLLVSSAVSVRPPFEEARKLNVIIPRDDGLTYRLSNESTPIKYEIWLTTRIHEPDFIFDGIARINIETEIATNQLVLNADSLDITQLSLTQTSNGVVIPQTHTVDHARQLLFITTASQLPAGTAYTINVVYQGRHLAITAGFHYASYVNAEGVRKYLASTQFQSVFARSVFPCYDEPKFRTPFIIHITHDRSLHALSNMPGEETIIDENNVETTFQETPSMPTYLVAFVVSDFEYTSNQENLEQNDVLHRIFAQPNYVDRTKFALDTSIVALPIQEEYFGQLFTLPKMDQIAIPGFQFGAMENWGLVTYWPGYLLFQEGVSTILDKQYIASVIAHEFAHMFFGNLVTLKWWSYLWLNEGFATLYEYYTTHEVYPELRMSELFVVEVLQNVLVRDAREISRPMTYYIESPDDIEAMFDSIAYSKAGSVIRMVLNMLTEPTYKKGINKYLANMKTVGVAEPNDLFSALQEAVDEDNVLLEGATVADIMNTWTLQKGFPILNVTRDYNNGDVYITQARFASTLNEDDRSYTWWVPINFASAISDRNFTDTSPDYWLPKDFNTILIQPSAIKTWTNDEWLIFNIQQTGYYRVNYDAQNWQLIAHELTDGDFEDIVPINRAQLIDDSFVLAGAGRISYDIPLSIVAYIDRETDMIPWIVAEYHIGFLAQKLIGSLNYSLYQQFMRERVEKIFSVVGVYESPSDNPDHARYRSQIVNIACLMQNPTCIATTKAAVFVEVHPEVNISIIPTTGSDVYFCHGIRANGEDIFLSLWNRLQDSEDQTERLLLINAFGCFANAEIVTNYLLKSFAISNENSNYTRNEQYQMLISVYRNGHISAAIHFILNNLEEIYLLYGNDARFASSINDMANYVISLELSEQFEELLIAFKDHQILSDDAISTARQIAVENMDWLSKNEKIIFSWLAEYYGINKGDGGDDSASSVFISISTLFLSFLIFFFNYYF